MTTTLTVDERQTLIARCYVALAEVDHDLREWTVATVFPPRWALRGALNDNGPPLRVQVVAVTSPRHLRVLP